MSAEIALDDGRYEAFGCWRCWPKLCRCAPDADEVGRIKADRLLLERMLVAERARRRAAESVIRTILDDHGNGNLSLSDIVAAAEEHALRHAATGGAG